MPFDAVAVGGPEAEIGSCDHVIVYKSVCVLEWNGLQNFYIVRKRAVYELGYLGNQSSFLAHGY